MTAIVTADRLVTALAQRVNAGADTSVSGPNKQLKDAMVAKNFFSGVGPGTGGISVDFAFAGMNTGELFTQGRPLQIVSKAVVDGLSDTAVDNPNSSIFKNYRWDSHSGTNTLGSWVDNTRFVFARTCFASINVRTNMVVLVSAGQRVNNLYTTIVTGNTSSPVARFGGTHVDRNYRPTEEPELAFSTGSTSYQRWFAPNDYIEVKYLACTSLGTAEAAHYGGLRNIDSAIEISAFVGM